MLSGVIFLLCLMSLQVASGITLNGNSYENINIVIEDNVPENEELLEHIQDIFIKASALLFKATRNHVYFGKVNIIVPSNWTRKDHYKPTPALSSTGSPILIGTVKYPVPHVKSIMGCGKSGEYMHLTPDFIMHEGLTVYGKHEHVIVHEWGHLRWGLRDEYGPHGLKFYRKDNEWRPFRCSEKLEGSVGYGSKCDPDETRCNVTSKHNMDKGCSFCPSLIQKFEGASIMSYQQIDALQFFCDKADSGVPEEEIHNKDANNLQNLFCNRKSSWEVMHEHPDFKNLGRLETTVDTMPTFEILQESNGSRVLVLDVSGSMRGERLNNMVSAAEVVIDQLLSQGSWLGIVSFSSSASVLADLRQINSDEDRTYLKSRLPTGTAGSTCISCGIKKGIEVLRKNTGTAENGLVILISDGHTSGSDMDDSIQSATEAKVVVHAIAIEQSADTRLGELATTTGGTLKAYLEVGEISFASVFAEAISQGISRNNDNFETIASENFEANPSAMIAFTIDKDLGRSTSVTVTSKSNGDMTIYLTGPDDYLQVYEGSASYAVLKIPGIAEAGDYILNITFDDGVGSGQLYVVSFPKTDDGVVRLITRLGNVTFDYKSGSLPTVYAGMSKNSYPVLGVHIKAIVEFGDSSCVVDLKDNGADPDLQQNDGTYSAFIGTNCLGSGRMSIKVSAKAANGTSQLMTGFPTAYFPESVIQYKAINDSFQRVSVAEQLTVINYVPDAKDIVEPGKVSDLVIRSVERDQLPYGEIRNVTIQWTPTGDDKSYGLASSYDIRMATVMEELLDDKTFITADIIAVQNATENTTIEEHQFSLIVNVSSPTSVYIALKAIDEVGNIGPISNIVLFGPSDDVFLNITYEEHKPNEEHQTVEKESMSDAVVIGIVIAIIVLLIICIIGSVVAYRIYRKRTAAKGSDVQPTLNKGFEDTLHEI